MQFPKEKVTIGTVARLNSQKDHSKIIEIAQMCKKEKMTDWHFAWIGEGALRKRYEQEIESKRLNDCISIFGAFDFRTGDPTVAPACVKLKTYPVTVEDGDILLKID